MKRSGGAIERASADARSIAPPERFIPIRITVEPTEDAIEGLVAIEFAQDGSQGTRLVAPFATTPGRPTTIDLVAALPRNVEEIAIELQRPGVGAREHRHIDVPAARDERWLPNALAAERGLIGLVGADLGSVAPMDFPRGFTDDASSNEDANGFWQSAQGWLEFESSPSQSPEFWLGASVTLIQPNELPASWAAYDSLAALVVDAGAIASIDPRVRRAIAQWVLGGGRLVVVGSGGSTTWRDLVPAEARRLVQDTEAVRAAVSPTLRERLLEFADALGGDETIALDPAPISQRLFRLTEEGHRHGWRTRWHPPDAERDRGPVAEGPVGFGWVTLVGLEPARASGVLDFRLINATWRELLTPIVRLRLSESPRGEYWLGSGANGAEQQGVRSAVDSVSLADSDPLPIFVSVLGGVGLLAILLGPIDFFVLKRLRLRHLSWLTATGYIVLFTLAGAVVPRLFRGGETEANRVEIVDVIRLAPADPDDLAGERAFTAWRTALTGLVSQSADPIRLDTESLGPDAAWRGVSSMTFGNARGARLPAATILARGTPQLAGPIPSPLWTFRALTDTGPHAWSDRDPTPDADVARAESRGVWSVELFNLLPGDEISNLHLITRDHTHHPESSDDPRTATATARIEWSVRIDHREPSSREALLLTDPTIPDNQDSGAAESSPPGVLDRNRAIAARLDTGRWALVRFTLRRPAGVVP
ncbi:MAG: hypothetical protein AAGK04_11025, partial [Planctomycetota bacterium]